MLKDKESIRKELFEKLNSQAKDELVKKSTIIKDKLFKLPEFKKAKLVMFYASIENEVKTHEMIDEAIGTGKEIALPRCVSGQIVPKEIQKNADLDNQSPLPGIQRDK